MAFPEYARRPVGDLLSDRIAFLESQILGLEANMLELRSEWDFAVNALKEWNRQLPSMTPGEKRTIQQSVLEVMSGTTHGWSQERLRQECLERFNHVVRQASLPAQMQRLAGRGMVRRTGGLWYFESTKDP